MEVKDGPLEGLPEVEVEKGLTTVNGGVNGPDSTSGGLDMNALLEGVVGQDIDGDLEDPFPRPTVTCFQDDNLGPKSEEAILTAIDGLLQKTEVDVEAHMDEEVPVNEFDNPGLAAMVFPDLFLGLPGKSNSPLAQADPTSQNRNFKVSERDGFKHLQWLSDIHPVTKLPYYPFADHICFKIEASKTPAELKEMLENAPNDAESMLGGLKAYAKNIVGSEAYWGAQAPVLEAACAQIAVPTVFGTLSFADGRNEDLQQILPGPFDPDQSKWAAKTRKFQQIVDFWFAKRSDESRWVWSRYEWQSRTIIIHLHFAVALQNSLDLINLCALTCIGRENQAVLDGMGTGVTRALSPDELLQIKSHIAVVGALAQTCAVSYVNMLIQAWNPATPETWTFNKTATPVPHPLSRKSRRDQILCNHHPPPAHHQPTPSHMPPSDSRVTKLEGQYLQVQGSVLAYADQPVFQLYLINESNEIGCANVGNVASMLMRLLLGLLRPNDPPSAVAFAKSLVSSLTSGK
ncbi:hypothetical protein BDR26DRAFT_959165 [Obelidium mucronatum]|nr:hypothetical protein BDR26DRAFT_959165 [Obelidium mucronatum]